MILFINLDNLQYSISISHNSIKIFYNLAKKYMFHGYTQLINEGYNKAKVSF